MVACSIPVAAPATPVAPTVLRHPWMIRENGIILRTLLDDESNIYFPALQRYLYNGTSPGSLGMTPSSFGRYLIYKLWKNHLIEEELIRLCNDLHFMAIYVILNKFAYSGLMPSGICNLSCEEFVYPISRFTRFVSREFIFPEKTVRVNIDSDYVNSLVPNYVGWNNRPRGCILILAYKHGNEFGVYQYGYKTSGPYIDQIWERHTDVNLLENAFLEMSNEGQIATELITEEHDAFHNLL